jgi:serine protease Do
VLVALLALLLPAQDAPDWTAVLAPLPDPLTLPAPRDEVTWLSDLEHAFEIARAEDRPLFVTLRCLPCKQCSAFDRDVLEGGPRLDPLLARFVTVRLTDAAQLDLDLLPVEGFQDLDLSWWGWFLSPEGRVYGVFGGRDEISDETRISVAALANTLERILSHHADPRRARWGVDGPAPDRSRARRPRDLPGFASWSARAPAEERSSCLHCHQVAEVLRQPALDAGTFDKQRDLEPWPLPENLGLVLDRDDGRRVSEVRPESPAEEAGLAPGDEVLVAQDRLVFGQADLRAALHRASRGATTIHLIARRGEDLRPFDLALADGWKRTVLTWRMSVSQGNVGAPPGFWPNGARSGEREAHGVPAGAMLVHPWFGPRTGPPHEAGLRQDHLLVAVDGLRPDLSGRAFMVWFRQRKEPGDEVRLTVLDEGREREIVYRLPTR